VKFDHLIDSLTDVIACDPGQSGSIVRLGKGRLEVRRGFKNLGDIAMAFAELLRAPGPPQLAADIPTYVVVEAVHAMPGQGVCSMFSFGKSTGTFYGAFYAFQALRTGLQLDEVSPQKWQNWFTNELGLKKGAGEFDSRNVIQMVLSPQYVDKCKNRIGNLDHNATDAVLMGIWKLATRPA
jgi:hypothetical protein